MKIKAAAIIPAAGSGSRMNSHLPKQYLELSGRPVLVHTVSAFHHSSLIDLIVVVVPADRVESTTELLHQWNLTGKAIVIKGGVRRQDSVKAGLDYLDHDLDIVLVHDGARPLVSEELIRRCRDAAAEHGAAIAAIPVKDTLKRGDRSDSISATIDRSALWQAQTPQAARFPLLRRAFAEAGDFEATDEASLLERAAIPVKLVAGSETNIKITRPEDLFMAERILMQPSTNQFRIGHGFDAHSFAPGRELVLGGVRITYERGLAGHSDADVVTHALCDAILGALGRGDIGAHFPDSAAEFKDIYSIRLLEQVAEIMRQDGYTIGNADITIICQEPRLASSIAGMKKILAQGCESTPEQINIKATTTEKMGYTGRKEGISSHAVVFLTSTAQDMRCR
ncbi:2-C-methyl-D-erythritol 4-phosphate cytidylyltransferase [Desulfopila inferna]|mgnify:CR=1 FL=1|uniref:2-C-methyl-D-erythritol 4-phosphate cytidylyltransferase n=1 Tax=Desulfopila inferna TaxID=468528 RepID=UPI001962F68A|nr:2-C-methyl-D-erythritol 4-phosphate cytidylyltransferase [Desulfopila inferna]MBM9604206.1 2-C-methyl-D-erythritol 4-phosphate cytidylyltransferase [Desulfopila inferna]